MQVDEEMKLLEEMDEIEQLFIEYVFKGNKDGQSLEVVLNIKEEKKMYKDISIGKSKNCILMK